MKFIYDQAVRSPYYILCSHTVAVMSSITYIPNT